jgi:prolyl-tRNA synthetase
MVMVHGDDKGLVLPPKIAAIQVIVIPVGITAKTSEEEKSILLDKVDEVTKELVESKIRAEKDDRDHITPGWKFNHWELMGVPIRVEVGPRDLKDKKVTVVLRWNQEKHSVEFTDLVNGIRVHLEQIHTGMYKKYARFLGLRNFNFLELYLIVTNT